MSRPASATGTKVGSEGAWNGTSAQTSVGQLGAWVDAALLFAAALALRLVGIGTESFWSDELFSVYWSERGQEFLWGEGRRLEASPPLYYAFLNLWISAVGTGEAMVRLPTAVASAAAIPIAYALGRTLLERSTALLGAGLLALSPMSLHQGQEARVYPFLMLANVLALLAIARQWTAGRSTTGAARLVWPSTFFLASVLGANAHYTGVFFTAACLGAIAIGLIATKPFPRREALIWAGTACVVAVGLSPILRDAAKIPNSAGMTWIWPLGPWGIATFFSEMLTGPRVPMKYLGFFAALPVLVLFGLTIMRRPPPGRAAFIVLVLTPVAFVLGLASVSLVRPLFVSRYGFWLVTPVALLAAHSVLAWRNSAWRAFAAVALLPAWGLGLAAHAFGEPREDWRRLAAVIQADPACAGPLMYGSFSSPIGLIHYAPSLAVRQAYIIESASGGQPHSESLLGLWKLRHTPISTEEITSLVGSGRAPVLILRASDRDLTQNETVSALITRARTTVGGKGNLFAWCL